MSGEGTDTCPEWGRSHGWMSRTDNGTLMLHRFNKDPIVLEIVDRFGQKIYPDPVATDELQAKINDRLGHYRTKRKLDDPHNHSTYTSGEASVQSTCRHGVPADICTYASCVDSRERNDYA